MRQGMAFLYDQDNHFTELKDNEILMQRIQMLQQMDPYIGKYYSSQWVKKNVLQLTDDEIKEMDKEIEDDLHAQLGRAEFEGTAAGTSQAAQMNYVDTFGPQEPNEQKPQTQQ